MKYYVLTVYFEREDDGRWTAECKELGTATYGKSLEEANEAIEEAIKLHIDGLCEAGEIKRFFKENNVRLFNKEPGSIKYESPVNKPQHPLTFVQPKIHQLQATCVN